MNASLIYEILMYLNSFYFGMYAAFEVGVGVLKGINLSYGENVLTREATILLSLCIIETLRIVFGRKSSLSDRGEYFKKDTHGRMYMCVCVPAMFTSYICLLNEL